MENLKELRSMRAEQVEQAEKAVEAGKPEEAQDALTKIKELDERISKVEEEIKELTDKEKGSKDEEPKKEDAPVAKEGEQRSMNIKPSVKENKESAEYRSFMEYLKSKGQTRAEGIKSTPDADVLIPKEVITQPVEQPNTVVDLKQFANVVNVKTPQGTYPILEATDEVMHTVEELELNPDLQKPKFKNVDYKVQTYRGQIAVN
ncbi:phage major capsid protein [Staphylococcus kloosii]|uniref:phage major capsid protein n=1 Tax=Staphylococcus kloosii TaxID=29384 RepID=UPI00189CCE85|nr:phage major capsid protein [Staphylococcus kloosii]MBF7025931.1 phage major capsid protein [Staphylococcus kloosii]